MQKINGRVVFTKLFKFSRRVRIMPLYYGLPEVLQNVQYSQFFIINLSDVLIILIYLCYRLS